MPQKLKKLLLGYLFKETRKIALFPLFMPVIALLLVPPQKRALQKMYFPKTATYITRANALFSLLFTFSNALK